MPTPPDLRDQWLALASCYAADPALVDDLFAQLHRQYTARSRHYHNLTHIGAMLAETERHAAHLADADAVRFAVWFHDAVYNPLRGNNEEKSVRLAATSLARLGFPPERTARVELLILRTKNHPVREANEDADTQFMLDCDLLVLGADAATYQEYVRAVRREYRYYPDVLYRPGRRQVLEKFLAMPRLYRTDDFARRFEASARRNLTAEVAALAN